jgi:hypothetical protein
VILTKNIFIYLSGGRTVGMLKICLRDNIRKIIVGYVFINKKLICKYIKEKES